VNPRPTDSTGKLDSAETNPLPHVSSARAWTAIASPTKSKSQPVIREKIAPHRSLARRVRADGTEEICADDIMLIVPADPARPKQPSSEELADADIVVEHEPPKAEPFRPPAWSVNVTQEILAEDVLAVAAAPLPPPPPVQIIREERPSTIPPPWTVDNHVDDLEFPNPPQYSGQYAAISSGPRITTFSATQVFRRRSANVKIVIASLSAAAAVVFIAGLARFVPTAGASDGPVGIAVHAPKKLDKSVRGRVLAYGNAPRIHEAETISIDALPHSRHR